MLKIKMSRILSLLVTFVMMCPCLMANGPLKKPLIFVAADSILVWGDDRSDFRATALQVAPDVQVRQIALNAEDTKKYKKDTDAWQKEILPELNILGGMGAVGDMSLVLPTTKMVPLAGKLFLQTADASYIDVLERVAYNAFMAILSPGDLSFEKHVTAQALMNLSGMVYATDDNGLYVNFYANSSTHIKTEKFDFVIDQLTAMPHSNRVKLRLSGLKKGQQSIVLRFRIPSWAYTRMSKDMPWTLEGTPEKMFPIYVNGREEFYQMENGYLVINRLWNSGDEVYFDFPFDVQHLHAVTKGRVDTEKYALQRGPLVYGFAKASLGGVNLDKATFKESQQPNAYGHSVLISPLDVPDAKMQQLEAQPVMDGVRSLWILVEQ